jgi:5-methylcytosine-specific restriction endonuclease McrA
MKLYRAKNRETLAEKSKQYREDNRETLAEAKKKYIAENREQVLEGKKRNYRETRESCLERSRRYYEANRASALEYQQNYRAEHRKKAVEVSRQWRLANPERYRDLMRLADHRRRARMKAAQVVEFTREQLDQRMAYYGHSCYLKIPGICTGGFDHVDHVKPISKGGPHMLANVRPACKPCNHRKLDHWPFEFAS